MLYISHYYVLIGYYLQHETDPLDQIELPLESHHFTCLVDQAFKLVAWFRTMSNCIANLCVNSKIESSG